MWEYQGRVVVPNDEDLKRQILRLYHDHLLAGHPGILRMEKLIAKDYWWSGLHQFVEGYVKGCGVCQATKVQLDKLKIPICYNGATLYDGKSICQVESPRPHSKAKRVPNDKGVKDEVEDKEIDVEEKDEEVQFVSLLS